MNGRIFHNEKLWNYWNIQIKKIEYNLNDNVFSFITEMLNQVLHDESFGMQ